MSDTKDEATILVISESNVQRSRGIPSMNPEWMNAMATLSMTTKGTTSKVISGGMAAGLLHSGVTRLATATAFSCIPILNVVSAISLLGSLFQDDSNNNDEAIMEMIQSSTRILSEQIGETYIHLRSQGIYILNQLDSVKLEMLNEFFESSKQRWNLKQDILEMQRDVQMRLENSTHLTLAVYGSINERLNWMEPSFYAGIDDRVSSTLNEALLACREDISLDVYQDLFRKIATIATLTSLESPMTGSEISLSENERVISALTSGRGKTLYSMNINILQQMYEDIADSKIEQIPNLELLSACVYTLASLMDNQFRSDENPSRRTFTSEWNCIEDIAELTCKVVNLIFGFKDIFLQLLEKYNRVKEEFKLSFNEKKQVFKNKLKNDYISTRRSRLRNEYNLFSSHTIEFARMMPGMVKNPQYLIELQAIKDTMKKPADINFHNVPWLKYHDLPHEILTSQLPLLIDLGYEKPLNHGYPYVHYRSAHLTVYVHIGAMRFEGNVVESNNAIFAWYNKYNTLRNADVPGSVPTNHIERVNAWIQWRNTHAQIIKQKTNSSDRNKLEPISELIYPDRNDLSLIIHRNLVTCLMDQPDFKIAYQAEFLGLGEISSKYTLNDVVFIINTYFKIGEEVLQIGKKHLPWAFNPPDYYTNVEKTWYCALHQLHTISLMSVINHSNHYQNNMDRIRILVEQKEEELEERLKNEMIPNSEVYLKRKELDAHYYRLKALSQFMFDNDSAFNIVNSKDVLDERKVDYNEDMNIKNPLINNIVVTLSRLKETYGDRDLPHQHIDSLLEMWHPPI
uniref:Uncharacterized protein n=1 Tax=Pithovirus LCPAC406 TaxID=2506599 RepID=A0A481ZFD5_9VIRU|nr:MAG: hypothetical protein LCPAC406_01760 [Pithovirus LCPAC406]